VWVGDAPFIETTRGVRQLALACEDRMSPSSCRRPKYSCSVGGAGRRDCEYVLSIEASAAADGGDRALALARNGGGHDDDARTVGIIERHELQVRPDVPERVGESGRRVEVRKRCRTPPA
jgi:hypothetical protein